VTKYASIVWLAVVLTACGPPQLAEVQDHVYADIAEFDMNCGLGSVVTSFLHLPDYFVSETRVLEVVGPELVKSQVGWEISSAVEAGGIWLFVATDDVVFGAADKASGKITYCAGG